MKGDGTYVDTRRLTGIQAGGFQIVASVSRPALSRFNVTRTIDTVVDAWELRARFRIAPDARQLIQRSVLEARRPLEDFLRQQEIERRGSAERLSGAALSLLLRPARQPAVVRSAHGHVDDAISP